MTKATIGFAMCGSFCTFSKAIKQMEKLAEDFHIIPIMSFNAHSMDTRFGKAKDFVEKVENITNEKVINSIEDAEPIGPKKMCDLMLVAPCTGNTLAKISLGITDTPVTMAVKSHLRIQRPVLLSIATNDALGASAQNVGRLLNTKHIYFVPVSQDDYIKKQNSLVAKFEQILECVNMALEGKQLQPVFA